MGPAAAPAWLSWAQQSAIAGFMRDSAWAYPAAEILHIVSFAGAVGCLLMIDLRLLGAGRAISIDKMLQTFLPWAIGMFCVAALTGSLLLLPDLWAIACNPAFLIKVGLIALAGANAALLHLNAGWRHAMHLSGVAPLSARLAGAASIILWVGVIASARTIAYV